MRNNANRIALVAAALIIVGALALRLATYDRFLPFMDYTDETWYYGFAQTYRGNDEAVYWDRTAHSPPPLQAFVHAQLITLVDQFHAWEMPSTHTRYLRLFSVLMGTVTTAAVMGGAWRIGGPIAGLTAGIVWGFHPQIIDINSLIIADPFMFMFVALALWTAIVAWQDDSPRWLLASLLAGIAAIYSKFWIASAVLPFGIVALGMTWRNPRRMIGWLVVYALIAASSAYYLLGVYDPLGTAQNLREADTFRNDGLRNAFDFDRWRRNWRFGLYVVSQPLFYGGLILGGAAYALRWRRTARGERDARAELFLLVMLLVFAVVSAMLSSTFTVSRLNAGKLRHVMPTALAAIMLTGWAVATVHATLIRWAGDNAQWRRAAWLLPAGVWIAQAAMMAPLDVALVQNYAKLHPVQRLWAYTDSSLPREGLVWLDNGGALGTVWNRPWGGYAGDKPFMWWNEPFEQMAAQSPQELAARDITHVIFSNTDYTDIDSPAARELLAQMLHVKTLPIVEDDVFMWHNQTLEGLNAIEVYRVLTPQHDLDVPYGDAIRLIGYDMEPQAPRAGDTVTLRFFWQADSTPAADVSLFVHVYPSDAFDVLAQADQPPVSASRPTRTWDDPDEVLISEAVTLSLPADLPDGDYRLAVGLYGYDDGQRLGTTHPDGFHVLPLRVGP